ncbi:MAG: alpha/beta hydrolase [Ruminococcus sp.]|nr:alpha/beta hydrolase [Ruminococcus sp.]
MEKLICILMICTLAVTLFACGAKEEAVPTEKEIPPTAAETIPAETTLAASQSRVARDHDVTYEVEMREIWCENNGNRIYGEAYIPVSDTETRFPLIIHAHGMGSNHEAGAAYLKRYAEKGYAGYTFDFPGGSRPTTENLSDGDPMQNSAVTEASDLQTILDTALTWDFVDTDYVFLEGGSMGGLVATMVGLDNVDTVAGMILHYPALYMPQAIISRYSSPHDVPDTMSFGDDYELGSRFATDLWDVDVISWLHTFNKPVTIIQGSDDNLVAASSIEEASHLFPNAEFHLIDGAGHGFSGDDFDTAVQYGLDYLFTNAY